jgi:hypothetical protein
MPRRPRPALCALFTVLATLAMLATSGPASAQADTTTDTRPVVEGDGNSPMGNILPRPNTGQAPDSPNDPGGWQQYLVFGLIIAGLALIVVFVARESRRARTPRPG